MVFNKATLSALSLALFATTSFGQGYVPGQLLAVRLGGGTGTSGSDPLDPSGINNNLSFVEFGKVSTGSQLTPRFQNTATTSIALNGTDPLSGTLTRSPNGIWFGVAGYIGTTAALGQNVNTMPSLASGTSNNRRRAWFFPFTGSTLSSLGTTSNDFGSTNLSGTAIRSAVTINGAQALVGHDAWSGSGARFFTFPSGLGSDGSIVPTVSVRYLIVAGGFVWYSTGSGIFRAPIPTQGGDLTSTQVCSGTDLVQFEFLNNQTLVAADRTEGLKRFTLSGANTFTNISSPVSGTDMNSTANVGVTGITTDGISVWATTSTTSPSGANSVIMQPYISSGTSATSVNITAGNQFVYRGLSLVPEFSVIGSCPTGVAGEVRVAMRAQGTGTDSLTRSCRIGTLNIATGRIITTNATIPMRGHFADMTVDRNGNTLILCTTPNSTMSGYNYSVIRVSPDGTQSDEGPLSGGLPSQAAPTGQVPIRIKASSSTNEASVLCWNSTSNAASLGIVTLPTSIGAGVSSISSWGPFSSATAAHRAVGVAYTRVSNQPAILYSSYSAPSGTFEIRTVSNSTTSTPYCQVTGVTGVKAIDLTFDGSDQTRVLQSGGNGYTNSGGTNNPTLFRVDTFVNGGTTALTTGIQYVRNNGSGTIPVNPTSTNNPIFGQVQAIGINWDAASGTSFLTHVGTSGSFTSADQRTNLPGSFRAWQMASATNNASASTYRFFPGVNFN